ncbi:MAG: hypothetical protein ACAI34_23980, partial [Verrucomicrobium sp.]
MMTSPTAFVCVFFKAIGVVEGQATPQAGKPPHRPTTPNTWMRSIFGVRAGTAAFAAPIRFLEPRMASKATAIRAIAAPASLHQLSPSTRQDAGNSTQEACATQATLDSSSSRHWGVRSARLLQGRPAR